MLSRPQLRLSILAKFEDFLRLLFDLDGRCDHVAKIEYLFDASRKNPLFFNHSFFLR